jgi:hypothetical protein
MPEPTSEWGRLVVDKLDRLEREFLKFQTKINTLVAVFGGLGATALALTGYVLLTLSGLQSSVAVLQSTTGRMSDDYRNDREIRESLRGLISDLQRERLHKSLNLAIPTPTPGDR